MGNVLNVVQGKYVSPRIRSANPDSRIRGGLKYPWVAVDPGSLPSDAKQVVEGWKGIYKTTMEAKDKLLVDRAEERAEKKKGSSEQGRKEYESKLKIRDQWRVDRLKVKILY